LNSEEEIKEIVVQDDETLDSGIAPPLRHVMQSKQRKNLNNSHIQSLEAKVDELLRLDEEAEDSHFELIDPESLNRESVVNTPQYFPHEQELVPQELLQTSDDSKTSDQVDDLELEIEQVLGEDELLLDGETGVEGEEGEEEEVVVEAEEDEESDDDDDDDDDDDNDNSDNEQGVSRKVEVDENEQHNALLRDEINELMSTIEQNKARLEKTHNPLLQSRVLDSINKLEKELENKKRQLKTGEDKTRKEQQDDEQTSRNTTSNNGDGEREDDEDEDENGQLGEEDDEDEDDDDELDELFG
jgi:transcription initiation factor TFIID subunit 7